MSDAPLWMTIVDVFVFLAVAIPFALLVRHRNAIPKLPSRVDGADLGRLSVIVPARDEEAAIRRALESLLAQDYPDLEIVAVDDRSSDGTGEVLRELATRDPRLIAIQVAELPAGWLGKNHALWRGAAHASGDWLLFTDADIVFARDALRRAVAYAVRERLDHLTLAPRLIASGLLLRAFVAFFAYAFITLFGAYLANDPKSDRGVGIGAFNLVRREAYERIGTIRALSLRPDDDIRLGRRIRAFGLRQRVLNGNEVMAVEWYPSLGAAVRGLEKSLYSSMEYRVVDAAVVLAFILGTLVWPYLGVFLLGGLDRLLLLAVVGFQTAGLIETHRQAIGRTTLGTIALAALLPVAALSFAFAIARSAFLAETRGVRWRGTTYPLPVLRAQSGLEGTDAKRRR
jgi:glycosyltransferase involved in cell wall biosynthesis